MKNAVVILITFLITSCAKDVQPIIPAPTTAERIQGVWETWNKQSVYHFSDGKCDQRVMVGEDVAWINEYWYTVDGDQICMSRIEGGEKSTHTVEFTSDTTMVLHGEFLKIYLNLWHR